MDIKDGYICVDSTALTATAAVVLTAFCVFLVWFSMNRSATKAVPVEQNLAWVLRKHNAAKVIQKAWRHYNFLCMTPRERKHWENASVLARVLAETDPVSEDEDEVKETPEQRCARLEALLKTHLYREGRAGCAQKVTTRGNVVGVLQEDNSLSDTYINGRYF